MSLYISEKNVLNHMQNDSVIGCTMVHIQNRDLLNQSIINQHHGLSPMQEVAAIYNKKELMSTISS